jgi:ABC-type antimicrobial peptide transport system permease subunit
VLTGTETGFAAAIGTALAWASYEVGRRIAVERIVFQGGHFWPEDMAVQTWLLVLILAGTPVLVMLASVWSMAWATNTPVISRYGRRPAPGVWTTVPLAFALVGTIVAGPLEQAMGSDLAGFFTVLLVGAYLLGFVLIGPWLCQVLGRGIARISRGVPGLIAAHRIAADPYAAFRSVSIVVLAVSAITYFGTVGGQLDPPVGPQYQVLRPGVVVVNTGGVAESRVAPLLSPQAVVVRVRGEFGPDEATCAELARVRYLSCPNESVTEPQPDFSFLPIREIYLPTDGSLAAETRIRAQAANLVPNAIVNSNRDPVNHEDNLVAGFAGLVYLATLFVLLLAVVGLTAGMTAGLLERRRPFALLRASGVRLGELRRVVLLETSATMALTSALGIVLGMVLGFAATRRAGLTWTWPSAEVYAYAGGAVLAALILSTLALPLLNAATRFDAIRYE